MAAFSYPSLSWCSASVPISSSASRYSSCLYPVNAQSHHINSQSGCARVHAKFEKFQGQENRGQDFSERNSLVSQSHPSPDEEDEDDSCLPSGLEGAIQQSAHASATFVSSGGMRAIVELLIPQLQFLDDAGAQAELWELSRKFLITLAEETGNQRVKAIFPDAGATALLRHQWQDSAFGFSSLGDRNPVDKEDKIVVMVVPDYQMLGYVERIASNLSDDLPRPLIMWNPRLVSQDVGVGINVRRLRRNFLSTFTVVYSMRPLPSGAVFRCYPGLWKVFYDDKFRPNRYLLAKEQIRCPTSDELEIIFGDVDDKQEKGTSLLDQAAAFVSSITGFLKVISR